jgi:hypothetical protein
VRPDHSAILARRTRRQRSDSRPRRAPGIHNRWPLEWGNGEFPLVPCSKTRLARLAPAAVEHERTPHEVIATQLYIARFAIQISARSGGGTIGSKQSDSEFIPTTGGERIRRQESQPVSYRKRERRSDVFPSGDRQHTFVYDRNTIIATLEESNRGSLAATLRWAAHCHKLPAPQRAFARRPEKRKNGQGSETRIAEASVTLCWGTHHLQDMRTPANTQTTTLTREQSIIFSGSLFGGLALSGFAQAPNSKDVMGWDATWL